MNELQTCLCFVIAIALAYPVVVGRNTPAELRMVAWITLCAAELMLAIFAVLMMQ